MISAFRINFSTSAFVEAYSNFSYLKSWITKLKLSNQHKLADEIV